jgi:hypothetical protein
MYPEVGISEVIIPSRADAVPLWQFEFAHVCPSAGEPEHRSGAPLGLEYVEVLSSIKASVIAPIMPITKMIFFMAFCI